ncbi:MAG: chorismate synthase [Actinobacteria bacterium]|nr:chorismate synthase [Actinomycetota bacterium]MCL6104171.1 chorismate synthase [Actinomycetota bacterium]
MLRFLTAGESHGQALVVIIEGLPAGLPIGIEEIQEELARRRLGFGRGPRMRIERDEVTILAGVRFAKTLGSPVAIEIKNSEWQKWEKEMSPFPGVSANPLTKPRPGHADLAGMQKYGFDDARNVLERASARETAARVVAGCLAKALCKQLDIRIISHVVALGDVSSVRDALPVPDDLEKIDSSPVRCLNKAEEAKMVALIKKVAKAGDSLGGVAEILAWGVPVGLGSYVHWDRKLDGLLAKALMSIPAIKAVEIGEGIEVATLTGSVAHDAIYIDTETLAYRRRSAKAGGIEGGVSNGEVIVARVYMKPLATLSKPVLETVDTATGATTVSFKERTDVTAVPAMGVVAEAMTALVLAGEIVRKFGGDSLTETLHNWDNWRKAVH